MADIKYHLGIDFGTTNSATVLIQQIGEEVRTIKIGDEHGGPFPSFVAIDNITCKVFVGRQPWIERNDLSQSSTIFRSLKTYLGSDKRWNIGGRIWTVEDIIAILFRALKENVAENTGIEIEEATVSIPIGFSSKKRQALRMAAEAGGINIKSFISESSAAFFNNYKNLKRFSKVAIFDWGGGTLDVSLVEVKNQKIKELAIKGMDYGGDHIDYKLAEFLHTKICNTYERDISFDDVTLTYKDALLFEAEKAKINLGMENITSISLRKYMDMTLINESITYEEFSNLIKKDVLKAVYTLEACVKSANMNIEELEAIILIGGSSNLRVLQDIVQEVWSNIYLEIPEDPGWSTAIGAAYLNLYPGSVKLNQDIGIILSDNSFYPINIKDVGIPTDIKSLTFGTVDDSQDAKFLFSDNINLLSNNNFNVIQTLTTQVYGFKNEVIEIEAQIDEDLTFRAKTKSNHKPEEYVEECEISNLRFYYELPEILEEL